MTSPDGDDVVPIVDVSATQTKKITLTALKDWLQSLFNYVFINVNGWVPVTGTWSYSAWDNTKKTGTITVPSGAASIYCINDWVKISQATGGIKYGKIITVADTSITVNMLTYTLNNETISSIYYSHAEQPVGVISLKSIKASAYNGAQQSITDDTDTIIALNTEDYDDSSSFDTSTYRFTCPISGTYDIKYNIPIQGNGTNGIFSFNSKIKVNGVDKLSTQWGFYPRTAYSIAAGALNAGKSIKLNKDDYIQISVTMDHNDNTNKAYIVASAASLSVTLLSAV